MTQVQLSAEHMHVWRAAHRLRFRIPGAELTVALRHFPQLCQRALLGWHLQRVKRQQTSAACVRRRPGMIACVHSKSVRHDLSVLRTTLCDVQQCGAAYARRLT